MLIKLNHPLAVLIILASTGLVWSQDTSSTAQKSGKALDLIVSEYSAVAYVVARGAPLKTTIKGKETSYFKLSWGVADQGEYNQRHQGGQWGGNPKLAMMLCGYLYKVTKPVVDVIPDAPKAGEALECKVVTQSDLAGEKLVDEYVFAWKKFEGTDKEYSDGKGKWVDADVPKTGTLAAGITKEDERWGCFVRPIGPDGKPSADFEVADKVEIGKETPGDSRGNWAWGAFYGQYRHVRGYFKFDVSELAGRKIKSAKFRIFCDVQNPPFTVNAYAGPNTWNDREITWVNQPLKFPFEDKPVGSAGFDFGPLPTTDNPPSKADWFYSSSPDFRKEGRNRAPAWREIEVTEYARRTLAAGEKSLSLCIAPESQSKNDHSRIHIHNDKIAPGYTIRRGDMRPRLTVELE